jgi:hypothetical protein
MVNEQYTLVGWDLKEFLKGNKEVVKAAIALGILFFGGMSPIANIIAAGLAKTILDVIDYYLKE